MNSGALSSLLGDFYWYQLRSLSRELGLSQKGNRQTLISRIMQMHSDPCCSVQVASATVAAGDEAAKRGKKRRRANKFGKAVRSLCGEFEAVAVSGTATAAPLYFSDSTVDAADYSDGGLLPVSQSQTPARRLPARAAPAVAQAALLTAIDSPDLIYVPVHLRGWQPSPVC